VYRFLRGYKYNTDNAAKALTETLQWRAKFKIDEITQKVIEQKLVCHFSLSPRSHFPPSASQCFSCSLVLLQTGPANLSVF
jgi:hypothetical protein